MTIQIALLRGINVGGHAKVAMADLRALVTDLGFGDVRSLLQTGNVVFRGDRRSAAVVERVLERELERRLGLRSAVHVRTASEWNRVVMDNPFPDAATRDPSHLVVMALKTAPAARAVTALQAAITGREVVRAVGRQAYIVYPDGIGRSRLTNAMIDKHLGAGASGRNWNTVLKLQALLL